MITLYHGTKKPFTKRTRKVHPTPSNEPDGYELGWRLAHATSDVAEALRYGSVVYEVKYDEHTQEGFGPSCYISEKGFWIVRRVKAAEIKKMLRVL